MTKGISIQLDVENVKQLVRHEMAIRLNKAAHYFRGKVVANLSTPYPPASPHGANPHARTGKLRQSINVRPATPQNLNAEVGTSLRYGAFLEVGTKKMAARPFLLNTLLAEKANIEAIIGED
jgi:HK97 gp10 family phage protein